MKSPRIIAIGVVGLGVALVAACSGGPGSLDFGGGGYDNTASRSSTGPGESAPGGGRGGGGGAVGASSGAAPNPTGTTTTTPTATATGTSNPPSSSGNPGNGCPTCGTYQCTAEGGADSVTFTAGANNSCQTTVDGVPISLACGGKVQSSGQDVGTWTGAGSVISVKVGAATTTCAKSN